jgi:hypothetical protein
MLRPNAAALAFLLVALTLPSLAADPGVMAGILPVLDAQAAAWTRGDLVGYMQGYEKSDATTFLGGRSVTRGWEKVLERYETKYGGKKEGLPSLTFSEVTLRWTNGSDAALVYGRWKLAKPPENPDGTFTIFLVKRNGAWKVIHDHSS